MKISVCIASIGRVSLIDTLTSIADCELPADITLEVVIADDSLEGSVRALLCDVKSTWKFQLGVYQSASKNIAIARNVCLSNATGDYLAFIDDDETADKMWLYNYLHIAEKTGADAIIGGTVAIYPADGLKWICEAKPFGGRVVTSGEKVNTGATGNAFVKRKTIEKLSLRFDPTLGQSGGEDTVFFAELHQMGGQLIATNEAKVFELIPLHRLTIKHLQSRYIRGGQTYARIFISSLTPTRKFRAYFLSVIKVIILFVAIPLVFVVRKDIALKLGFKLWLNFGRLRHMLELKLPKLY